MKYSDEASTNANYSALPEFSNVHQLHFIHRHNTQYKFVLLSYIVETVTIQNFILITNYISKLT